MLAVPNATQIIVAVNITLGQRRQDSFSISGLTIPELIVMPTNKVPLFAKITSQSAITKMNSESPEIETNIAKAVNIPSFAFHAILTIELKSIPSNNAGNN